MNTTNGIVIAIVVVLVAALCCVCLVGGAVLLGVLSYSTTTGPIIEMPQDGPLAIPTLIPLPSFGTPEGGQGNDDAPLPQVTSDPANPAALDTLALLEDTVVPGNDPMDLAKRLKGITDLAPTAAPAATPAVGESRSFWVTNTDTNVSFQVTATLRYVGENMYFWIEDGTRYDERDLKALGDTFDQEIYPTNRDFFGSEWTPGIDNDPRLYILYAGGLGSNLAGYFSSADELNPAVRADSNGHEMFLLSSDNVSLDEDFAYSVLAHEFQHMIHWYRDRNEESWLNEGFSELAAFLNGYDVGGQDFAYAADPDLQLNDWPNDPSATGPHYGAGFLFLNYFLARFGDDATQALVEDPENGLTSIDTVLDQQGAQDGGQPITADDVFEDWVVASYLQDPSVGDGRYVYKDYPGAPRVSETETLNRCRGDDLTRDVRQYGVDYIQITCRGDLTLSFAGTTETTLLPEDPASGEYAFWSNKGDESDMTLTREFDFSNVEGPIEMTFQTWYDIEEDYDFTYLVASTDGEFWEMVDAPGCSSSNITGNNYGCGYNGVSGGWVTETVDLSQYAGQTVQLRFEYVTDAAVNGEGFMIDDISVPALDYATDFEADDGGWEAAGFVRVQNVLPQSYKLSLILVGRNETTVQEVTLDELQRGEATFSIGGDVREAVLVVSGTARFTRTPAVYQFSIR